jgi:hypothetical protein
MITSVAARRLYFMQIINAEGNKDIFKSARSVPVMYGSKDLFQSTKPVA